MGRLAKNIPMPCGSNDIHYRLSMKILPHTHIIYMNTNIHTNIRNSNVGGGLSIAIAKDFGFGVGPVLPQTEEQHRALRLSIRGQVGVGTIPP